MDRNAFHLLAASERDHWWFRGRRALVAAALNRVRPSAHATILDAGCGSGGNLELLARYGRVYGFEYDAEARAAASARQIGPIAGGALPDDIPFGDQTFDVIGLFDVLEHLEHPVASLRALGTRLAPGGAIVVTVPAIPALWGPHDVAHQHYRRYTTALLRAHLAEAGLTVEYMSSFNTLLLPLAVLQRVRERLFGYHVESLMPPRWLNALFYRVFLLERLWIPFVRVPLGLSLLAIARRKAPARD
jgi:SAM-dependent methyltransferase